LFVPLSRYDGSRPFGRQACRRSVELQLADRNAHAVGVQVAQAKDLAGVGHAKPVEVGRLVLELQQNTTQLRLNRLHHIGNQPDQSQRLPLGLRKAVDLLILGSCNRSTPRLVMPVLEIDIDFSPVQIGSWGFVYSPTAT
jgi:hypothetical protein